MTSPIPDIVITIRCNGYDTVVHTYEQEYRSLMQLITDQVIVEDFGECRGMGRCLTCKVRALNHQYGMADYDRNEWANLSKSWEKIPNIRLSCQIMVDKNIHGLHFEIAEPG